MKVVVLGGCGAMGTETSRDLAMTSEFDQITIADIDMARAQALADELNLASGRDRVRAAAVDASDEEALYQMMHAHDAVANAMTYHFGLNATRAAIRARVPYVDLGGLHNTPKQLAMTDDARAADVAIVLGCGATPGITNLLARRGADALDQVDEIHIAFASHRSIAPSPGLLDTILDEFNPEASRFYFESGDFVEVKPFDGARTVPFLPPVGEQEVYYVPHSETHTLPRFIGKGLHRVDVRGAWRPEIMRALRMFLDYRLITSDPVSFNGTTVHAKQFLRAHLLRETAEGRTPDAGDWAYLLHVEVIGTREGRQARRMYRTSHPPMSDWARSATARMTGIPASIGIQLLADGAGLATGILGPEVAFDPQRFIGELARRGIYVEERIEEGGVIDARPADALFRAVTPPVANLSGEGKGGA